MLQGARLLAAASVLLTACEQGDYESCDEPAAVSIVAPDDGAVVAAGDIAVDVDITYLWLARARSPGLWRRSLDFLAPVAHACDYPLGHAALFLDGAQVAEMREQQYTLAGVDPGQHVLAVELYYQDGTLVNPPAADQVSFTAE